MKLYHGDVNSTKDLRHQDKGRDLPVQKAAKAVWAMVGQGYLHVGGGKVIESEQLKDIQEFVWAAGLRITVKETNTNMPKFHTTLRPGQRTLKAYAA